MKTPEQLRAENAWNALDKIEKTDTIIWKDFASLCKQTVARTMNSGVLAALSYLDAKGKPPKAHDDSQNETGPASQNYRLKVALARYLEGFVSAREGNPRSATAHEAVRESGAAQALILDLIEASPIVLRRAQQEALTYLEWLARLAEGRKAQAEAPTTSQGREASDGAK